MKTKHQSTVGGGKSTRQGTMGARAATSHGGKQQRTERLVADAKVKIADRYIRMSTKGQAKGDSINRQTEALEIGRKWAEENGYSWSNGRTMQDERSSFHGDHLSKGQLGEYVALAEAGTLEGNRALIIENFDRLSRQNIEEALSLLLRVVNSGIVLVVIGDGTPTVFEKGKIDAFRLFQALFVLVRGNEESETKSHRVKAAYQSKKQAMLRGEKTACFSPPRWLLWNKKSETWDVKEEQAAVIREIFERYARGESTSEILNWLKESKTPTLTKHQKDRDGNKVRRKGATWYHESIRNILTSRQVIGEKVVGAKWIDGHAQGGTTVEGYFPAIVDRDTFNKVQARLPNKAGGGRRLRPSTIFPTGMVKCATCGGTVGKSMRGTHQVLNCNEGMRQACDVRCAWIDYDAFSGALLSAMAVAGKIAPKAWAETPLSQARTNLENTLALQAATQKRIDNITKSIEHCSEPSAIATLSKALDKASLEAAEARKAADQASYQVTELEHCTGQDIAASMMHIQQLKGRLKSASEAEQERIKKEVAETLRTMVQSITIDLRAMHAEVTFKTGGTVQLQGRKLKAGVLWEKVKPTKQLTPST